MIFQDNINNLLNLYSTIEQYNSYSIKDNYETSKRYILGFVKWNKTALSKYTENILSLNNSICKHLKKQYLLKRKSPRSTKADPVFGNIFC